MNIRLFFLRVQFPPPVCNVLEIVAISAPQKSQTNKSPQTQRLMFFVWYQTIINHVPYVASANDVFFHFLNQTVWFVLQKLSLTK